MKIEQKIDRAGELDVMIKDMTKELNSLKAEIKEEAQLINKKMILGISFAAIFSVSSKSTSDPKAVLRLLKKQGKEKDFIKCVTISITSARKVLGEANAAKVIKMTSDEFGRVSFKPVE